MMTTQGAQLHGNSRTHRRKNVDRGKLTTKTNHHHMNKHTHSAGNELSALAENARAFMAATADVAGEKVEEARKRLAAALESSKEIYSQVRDQAADCARATDEAVHEHPYQAIGIAFGVGAILGFLVSRRSCCKSA
jgi:ElaB/YqjD/DUF883 family membrane-anchored ribosome-binding protein